MILAIDPGRSKFGWAFVDDHKKLILSGITPTEELDSFISILAKVSEKNFSNKWIMEFESAKTIPDFYRVVLGAGTGSKIFEKKLKVLLLPIHTINEKNSTLEARDIYWKLHKPSVWQRLLPHSTIVPSRDIDDLAAYCLALRYLDFSS